MGRESAAAGVWGGAEGCAEGGVGGHALLQRVGTASPYPCFLAALPLCPTARLRCAPVAPPGILPMAVLLFPQVPCCFPPSSLAWVAACPRVLCPWSPVAPAPH